MTLLQPGVKATFTLEKGTVFEIAERDCQMLQPIRTYHVFKFNSAAEAEDARLRITQLLTMPSGAKYLKDDPAKRAVILSGPPTTLYISPGALEVATILWINLPTSPIVKASELAEGPESPFRSEGRSSTLRAEETSDPKGKR